MKKHTFAICAYKESPYLEECVKSLKRQTISSDIIVATSTPCEYIQNIAEKYKLPYYINHGEKGITQDWNFAYSCADSKYVTITHQDDIYEDNYLEQALLALDRSKRPLIFFSDYYELRSGKKVRNNILLNIKRIMLLPLRIKCFRYSRWVRRRILSIGSPICCPSVTYAVGNLPAVIFAHHFRSCEDWEAWEKISRLNGEFLYCPKLLIGHRIHEDSETTAIIGDNKRSEEEYEMFRKFWPKIIAGLLNKPYSKSQISNRLKKGN